MPNLPPLVITRKDELGEPFETPFRQVELWANTPLAIGRCWRNAAFTVPANAFTWIPFDTQSFVRGVCRFVSTPAGNTGIQVPYTGYYQVNGEWRVTNTNAAANVAAIISHNGSGILSVGIQANFAANAFQAVVVSDIVYLIAKDVVNLIAYNATAAAPQALQVADGAASNYLSVSLLGP